MVWLEQVKFTSEDLNRWGHAFSFLMVTTRKWARDPTNIRILRYFTAITEAYDNHYMLQVREQALFGSSEEFTEGMEQNFLFIFTSK